MKIQRSVLGLVLYAAIGLSVASGCKAKRTGKVAKNSPVPASSFNNDSTGTTPTAKLTPSPVPNVRPNPIPDPLPPSPPM